MGSGRPYESIDMQLDLFGLALLLRMETSITNCFSTSFPNLSEGFETEYLEVSLIGEDMRKKGHGKSFPALQMIPYVTLVKIKP